MRSTRVMCQSAQVKYQVLLDHLRILKESIASAGEKQELIDIVSSKVAECEFAISDLALLERNLRHDCETRTGVLSPPGSANREKQRRLDE